MGSQCLLCKLSEPGREDMLNLATVFCINKKYPEK